MQKFRKLSGKLPGRVRVERGSIRERLQNTGDVPGMCRVMTSATSAEDRRRQRKDSRNTVSVRSCTLAPVINDSNW